MECEAPPDFTNDTQLAAQLGYGCTAYGGQWSQDVQLTRAWCTALPGIECDGPRRFMVGNVPCVRYTGQYFLSTLLFSIMLGWFGVDRFCLGYVATGIIKLLTLGGFGVWWLVDMGLIAAGLLTPADGSVWEPLY